MRLQVFVSQSGVCSRRKALGLIQEGHVQLNGRIETEPSTPVDPHIDRVTLDGRDLGLRRLIYVIMNKPSGVVTTKSDRHASRTVLTLLPPELHHLNPVGRLDKNTEGLLLFTNDGALTHRLLHPRFHIPKTYAVIIRGRLTDESREKLRAGFLYDGIPAAPAQIAGERTSPAETRLLLTIREGRKRQIRLMFAALGHQVVYLKRLSMGSLRLGKLPVGHWRNLSPAEIQQLHKDVAGHSGT